jgi:hypothetical protein
MSTTPLDSQLQLIPIIAQIIAEATDTPLGGMPSGHLYARVMGTLSLAQYDGIIRVLKKSELVTEKNHLLAWVGPKLTGTSGEPPARPQV